MQIVFFSISAKDLVLVHWANKLPAFRSPVATGLLGWMLINWTGQLKTAFAFTERTVRSQGSQKGLEYLKIGSQSKECTIGILIQVSRHRDQLIVGSQKNPIHSLEVNREKRLNFEMRLGRTHPCIRAVKEEAYDEQHSHTSGCSYKPQRKSPFCPARLPGDCWSAIREAIWYAPVRKIGFLTTHDSVLQLKK